MCVNSSSISICRQGLILHAVIFDIDGTLLHSAAADDQIYREAVESVLGPVSFRGSLHDYDAVTDSGILQQILADNPATITDDVFGAVKQEFLRRTQLHITSTGPFSEISGARNILGRLTASHRHKVAIATGGWRATAELKLRTAGFDVSGIPLATSDDAIERTEIMQIALANLGQQVEAVTYFGDGEWDRTACHRLGWTFVAVGPALGGIEGYHGALIEQLIARPGAAVDRASKGRI